MLRVIRRDAPGARAAGKDVCKECIVKAGKDERQAELGVNSRLTNRILTLILVAVGKSRIGVRPEI
jgi:hypothetical protein